MRCELSRNRSAGVSVVTTYVKAAQPMLKPIMNKDNMATMVDLSV
jgi:hypothetical protein